MKKKYIVEQQNCFSLVFDSAHSELEHYLNGDPHPGFILVSCQAHHKEQSIFTLVWMGA